MKQLLTLFACLIFSFLSLNAAPVIFQYDNGTPAGTYSGSGYIDFDETAMLKPPGPYKLDKVQIYLSGDSTVQDTIWIVGDPAEGAYPPSDYCWSINKLAPPKLINYTGKPGWFEIDVSGDNIRGDGLCSIVIQHRIKPYGPYFNVDNKSQTAYHSWLVDPKPNPNFLNIGGTLFTLANGNYMVRFVLEYDYPSGDSSANPPAPTLLDVTREAGLVDGSGNLIKSDMASIVDWNKDGYDDIAVGSMFFQNNGDGTFKNVTSKINIQAGGTCWADIDNDGYVDCFALNGFTHDKIYFGNPDGSFTEQTDTIIQVNEPTVTPMFFDYNHDGMLDLYVADGRTSDASGNETYYPDQLFKNKGNRKFENVRDSVGIAAGEPPPYYDCWGASICDFNNDNYPDVFVATYRLAPDLLYENMKNGTFNEVGAATGARGIPTADPSYFGHGMGSDWGDFNNDGLDDLCVGNLGHPDSRALYSNPSLIFKNNGGPNWTFTDMHSEMGLKFFEMNAGACWADLNLDGYLDLVHAEYSYDQKGAGSNRYTRFYLNEGPDKNFKLQDITWEAGSLIHGAWTVVRLDYDNDGDMDILVSSGNENIKLFRNDIPNKGNWIAFRLSGSPQDSVSNDCFGSNVTVYAGGKLFYRSLPGTVMNGRSAQSSNELNFGIGANTKIDSVLIKYPSGKRNKFTDLVINTKYKIPYMQEPVRMGLTAPMLNEPENFAIKVSINTVLNWSQVSNGTKYELVISEKADFSTITSDDKDISVVQILKMLEINKTYYWKVRAYSGTDTSRWSSVWVFTTGLPLPSAPVLKTPVNDSMDITALPLLTWMSSTYKVLYAGTTTYNLQIASDSAMTNVIKNFTGLKDTLFQVTPPLPPATKLYWRVRGMTENQPGDWSETWHFTTIGLPLKPVLTSPANGTTNVSTKPNLSWEASTNAYIYSLQISKSETFDSIYYSLDNITSNSRKIFFTLAQGTKFYWHVKGVNDGGESDWSDPFYFVTQGTIGVDEQVILSHQPKISPNPFESYTTIEFEMAQPCFTNLKIYNLEGVELETILSKTLESGEHTARWNAVRFPSGVYYYQLTTGNSTYTGKLVLIK